MIYKLNIIKQANKGDYVSPWKQLSLIGKAYPVKLPKLNQKS